MRDFYNQSIESGNYTSSYESYVATLEQAHKVANSGADGTNAWYHKAGHGTLDVNAGQIRNDALGLRSNRVEEGMYVEDLARKYGDPYRTDGSSRVQLEGISPDAQPQNIFTRHHYPAGIHMDQYLKQMHRTAQEALDLIQKAAPQDEILRKLAEHYQYAINARPFGQINNSFFMNEINTLLEKAGMRTMPHGMLDHAAQRMQPEAFTRYFIDEYKRTAL